MLEFNWKCLLWILKSFGLHLKLYSMCFISDHFVMFCSVPGGPANVLWRWILQSSGVAQFQDKWLADKELGSLDELQHYYHSEGILFIMLYLEMKDSTRNNLWFILLKVLYCLIKAWIMYVCWIEGALFSMNIHFKEFKGEREQEVHSISIADIYFQISIFK